MNSPEPSYSGEDDSFGDFLREVARAPVVSTVSSRELEPGAVLDGHLRIESLLGRGGMGVVYLAHHIDLDRQVALKLTRGEPSPKTRARMLAEARALAAVGHPNIVAVYDVGTLDDGIYIAMELVRGGTARSWLHEKTRTWRDVLDIYIQAGRGLVAAHNALLVHRDFKPDNILVGDDGRVRVCDFGVVGSIASRPDDAECGSSAMRASAASHARTPSIGELTAEGSVVGTRDYMAPEQEMGQAVGARSDQFSFCVALYEALFDYRQRFSQDSSRRDDAVGDDKIGPRAMRRVPSGIRRALLRGMAADPDDRFPDMQALLVELERGRRGGRRAAALGLVASACTLSVAALLTFGGQAPCTRSADRLSSVWTAGHEQRGADAFARTGLVLAAGTWEVVASELNGYAAGWVAAHRDACEATRVHKKQSEMLMDLRMQCLADRRDALAAVVTLFERADRGIIVNATRAVAALPAVDACEDAEALRSLAPIPATARRAGRALQERISGASAAVVAGRYIEAEALGRAVLADAEVLGTPLFIARAGAALANALERQRRWRDAQAHAERALSEAISARDDVLAADLMIDLVCYEETGPQVEAAADARIAQARAWLTRLDHPLALELRMAQCEGKILAAQGEVERAVEVWKHGAALAKERGARPIRQLRLLAMVATGLRIRGKLEASRRIYDALLPQLEALMVAGHPYLAEQIHNAALTDRSIGDLSRARQRMQRSLELRLAVFGEESETVIETLLNLSSVEWMSQQPEQAIALENQATKILESFTPTDPAIEIAVYVRVAGSRDRAEGPAAALAVLQTLWPRVRDSVPAEHQSRIAFAANAANFANAAGQHRRALEFSREGLAGLGADASRSPMLREYLERQRGSALLPEDPDAALQAYQRGLRAVATADCPPQTRFYGQLGVGSALLKLGRHDDAVDPLRAASAIDQIRPYDQARARLLLARAYAQGGASAKAAKSATEALNLEIDDADLEAELRALLESLSVPLDVLGR